jgi:CDP-glucose 4,6-dehydratase
MSPEFWRHKRVLITGHTGFKGSWLSLWLQSLGAHLVGYGLEPPTQPALFELARLEEGMTCISGDVRDEDHLRRAMAQHRPEIVFHLAAQPLVRESYRNPVGTFATNVMGTVHVLEAVRQVTSVQAVVCITSDKCYENKEWLWGYRENEAMGGHDPYSNSKGCAELVAKAYGNLFLASDDDPDARVALATARAGNVIGGGDWAKDRLVPDILRSLMSRERVMIRNPQAIRPWQHVLDPLNGYLTLAEHLYTHGQRFGGGWNFGPPESNARPVKWVVEQLQTLWGADLSWQPDERLQPHEDIHLRLDCSKARFRLNWQAHLELRTALELVVDWFRAFQAGSDMREVSRAQIKQFMEKYASEGTDETDRREADPFEAPLSIDKQEQLLELAPDTIIVRRVDGTITYWNQRAEQLYGWTKAEALGNISHSLLQTRFPSSLTEIDSQLLSTGHWEGPLVHTTRGGRRLDVSSYWAVQPQEPISHASVLEVNRVGA